MGVMQDNALAIILYWRFGLYNFLQSYQVLCFPKARIVIYRAVSDVGCRAGLKIYHSNFWGGAS